jgi:hypothetical protein
MGPNIANNVSIFQHFAFFSQTMSCDSLGKKLFDVKHRISGMGKFSSIASCVPGLPDGLFSDQNPNLGQF